ncbi:hypothetical protein PTKIN_Ptkin05aG0150700 [Pterospermum kingtungense]
MAMATASADVEMVPLLHQLNHARFSARTHHVHKLKLTLSQNSPLRQSCMFPPTSLPTESAVRLKNISSSVSRTYVTGPDPIATIPDPRSDESEPNAEKAKPPNLISWQLVWSLLVRHKLRIGVSAEFFDRRKVGELSGLRSSDMGSLNNCFWDNMHTVCSVPPTSPNSGSADSFYVCFSWCFLNLNFSCIARESVYKRSTIPVFKAHGLAEASMSDCVTETFSAIRTVLAYQKIGIKLGTSKSINESLTRVATYISLLALYCLGGLKVKAGELSVGAVSAFIGYTFTLTFAVQGLVNTLGDLHGTFAAVERINSVIAGAEIDEALADGLEKEIQKKEVDENIKLFISNGAFEKSQELNSHYMSALKSSNNVGRLTWSGDVCLEDVRFSYPLRPNVEILNGLNLNLKCGTVTALLGSSGAGKSTIVQLLARFYEV